MATSTERVTAAAMREGPRGPRGLPVIGIMRELQKDNIGFLTGIARSYGDVARYRLLNRTIYQINHPGAIKRILQDNADNYGKGHFRVSSLTRLVGSGLIMSEGAFWRRQRRLMQPAFHPKNIASFGEQIVSATYDHVERWTIAAKGGEALDIAAEMMRLTLDIATRTLFSSHVGEDLAAIDKALAILNADVNFRFEVPFYPPLSVPTPRNHRAAKAIETLDRIVYRLIDDRARQLDEGREVPPDLLTRLLQAQDEDSGQGMTRQQLRDEVMTLFIAGHETTAKLLTWCWYLLSTHPDIERKVHGEAQSALAGRPPTVGDLQAMPYSRMVLEETLRLYPPAWIMSRQAVGGDVLCGHAVAAGTLVWFSPYVMHRHPDYWPNPEGFDPERFKADAVKARPRYAYFPFGGGGHQCIGKHFALLEAQLVLAAVIQRYSLELVPGRLVVPRALVTLAPQGGLPMTVRARS